MKVPELVDAFHNIIKALKKNTELSDVRFVRRYGTLPAENPVKGYLAACGVSEMKSAPRFLGADSPSGKERCILTGTVDFYAPFSAKSSDAERKTALISREIFRADTGSFVTSVEVKDVDYDSEISAFVRKILVKMEACVSEEEEL